MGFEVIENIKPSVSSDPVPDNGVRVRCRTLTRKKSGVKTSWIIVDIGRALSKKLALIMPEVNLNILFGSDRDAGKIAVSVDIEAGEFPAKRNKSGIYSFTINAATSDGLFSTDFPKYSVPDVAVVCESGTPPRAVFTASKEMLAVDD